MKLWKRTGKFSNTSCFDLTLQLDAASVQFTIRTLLGFGHSDFTEGSERQSSLSAHCRGAAAQATVANITAQPAPIMLALWARASVHD